MVDNGSFDDLTPDQIAELDRFGRAKVSCSRGRAVRRG